MTTRDRTGRLAGKSALVTGAASGIGAATSRQFAIEGADLVLVDLDSDGVEATAKAARGLGGRRVETAVLDLTDEDAVAAAFADLRSRLDQLHVLFNCAGGSTASDDVMEGLDGATWASTLSLELFSLGHVSRWGVPWIRESGGGSIINMSSFAAFRGTVRIHAYAAAKGGVAAATRTMAGSYARDGIRVNAIAPGVALSERARRRITEPNVAASLTFAWEDYPFALGDPDDIAAVATFLASDESRMITGQTIMADGGLTAY